MKKQKERIEFEVSAPKIVEYKESYGAENFKPDISKVFIEFILNHTLPDINSRGRCVTYRTQKRSLKTIPHSLVNVEHQMQDNPNEATENIIIGHMVSAEMDDKDIKGNPVVPPRPVATKIVACLYRRLPIVQTMIAQIASGERKWKNSMECVRDGNTDAIYHDGKFYPITEASKELAACIGSDSTTPFEGKPVALALGGEDGEVNYWGTGLTLYPADKGATITKLIANIADDGTMSVNKKDNPDAEVKDLIVKSMEVSKNAAKILKCPNCGNTAFQELMTVEGQTPRIVKCPLCKTQMETAKADKKDIVVSALPKLMIHSDGTEEGTEIYIDGRQLDMENIQYVHFSYYPTPDRKDRSPMAGPPSVVSFGFSREETYDGVRRRVSYDFFIQKDGTIASKKREGDADANDWGDSMMEGEIARWISIAQENKMPDSHFLWVKTEATDNKAKDRKLPYKYPNGKLSRAGLRGAWAVLHGARGGADLAGGPGKDATLAKCRRAIGAYNRQNPDDKITISENSNKGGDSVKHLKRDAIIELIKGTGMDDAARDQVVASLDGIVDEALSGAVAQIKKTWYKPETHKKKVEEAVANAKKIWEKEVKENADRKKKEDAKLEERGKAVSAAGFVMTDYRRGVVGKMAIDDVGDKEFSAFLEDLKKTTVKASAASKGKKGKNFKPDVAGGGGTGDIELAI